MSVIYGESGCGKTFFALDLALHVAAGIPWRGREVDRGGVLYLALEGSHGIRNRVAAFKAANCAGDADLPFAVVPVSVNLLDPNADTENVIAAAKAAAAKLGVPIKLIVVDTLSRALAGGNENDPKDMGAFVRNLDKIRQALPAHVAVVHHSGKDSAKGARGHSLLRAATDTEIEVTRDPAGKISTARVTKQRELDCDGRFAFRLESVSLGTNRRGKAVTSCVVRPIDAEDLAAQAEAAAVEKAAEIAERKADAVGRKVAEAAAKSRIKTEAAAARIVEDSEKVYQALKTICELSPGATKNRIRETICLDNPRTVAALAHLIQNERVEACKFAQESGNRKVSMESGYRVTTTPGTPGLTPGQESTPGVNPGVARMNGERPDEERPDRGFPLKGNPSGNPDVPHPQDPPSEGRAISGVPARTTPPHGSSSGADLKTGANSR